MNKILKRVSYWALFLLISGLLNELFKSPKQILAQITPMSLFQLELDTWKAFSLTFSASIISWIIGIAIGRFFGFLAASTSMSKKSNYELTSIGKVINRIAEWIYVIPFVLTTTFTYALVLVIQTKYGLPKYVSFFSLVAISGIALGGFHIYKSVVDAVVNANQKDRLLIESLFFKRKKKFIKRHSSYIKRLHDCRIHHYCSSLQLAFHLSIVAIMIVETITPSFYELLWPSSGAIEDWKLGAGRLIIQAQNSGHYEIIAGCIWAVLLFDTIFISILNSFTHKSWLKHY